MDSQSLEPVLPPATVATKSAEHDDLAAHFTQIRDPVLQKPHIPSSGAVHDLVMNGLREQGQRRRLKVLLLDGHDDRLARRLWSSEEAVDIREHILEGRPLGEYSVVGNKSTIDYGESDVYDANARRELNG